MPQKPGEDNEPSYRHAIILVVAVGLACALLLAALWLIELR